MFDPNYPKRPPGCEGGINALTLIDTIHHSYKIHKYDPRQLTSSQRPTSGPARGFTKGENLLQHGGTPQRPPATRGRVDVLGVDGRRVSTSSRCVWQATMSAQGTDRGDAAKLPSEAFIVWKGRE